MELLLYVILRFKVPIVVNVFDWFSTYSNVAFGNSLVQLSLYTLNESVDCVDSILYD